jgi:D-amino-acid dehydrogenase
VNNPSACVVGAGIVGLSVAWFLQEHNYDVTVVERSTVAGGASRGNAGWVCPGLVAPLPEPAVLRYAAASVLNRDAPLRISARTFVTDSSFLWRFARNCTTKRWYAALQALEPITRTAHEAYDCLARGGVSAAVCDAPIDAAFVDRHDAAAFARELEASHCSSTSPL